MLNIIEFILMLVEPHYSTIEAQDELSTIFGIGTHTQDWDLVNARADLVFNFIDYFLNDNREQLDIALFELILASIDELQNDSDITKALESLRYKLTRQLELHAGIILYWCAFGSGKSDVFPISLKLREFWNTLYLVEDTMTISNPDMSGIKLNGVDLLDIVTHRPIAIDFDTFSCITEQSCKLKISKTCSVRVEIEQKHTHMCLYDEQSGQHYYRFKSQELKQNVIHFGE